jgi:dihydrofolate reductase
MAGSLCIIVACDENGGIGRQGTLPWVLAEDLHHFKTLTSLAPDGHTNAIIMGRRTWESLPIKPLPHRLNIVISNTFEQSVEGTHKVFNNIQSALDYVKGVNTIHKTFIIGGAQLYEEVLSQHRCDRVYLTLLRGVYNCDVFFPLKKMQEKYCLVNEGCLKQSSCKTGNISIGYTFHEYAPCKDKI